MVSPLVTDPLVEIHQSFKYDGSRDLFNSDATLCETVYHDHVVNGNLTITAQTQDEKCYDYMADGQVATVHYNYQGLDEHTIAYTYNDVRIPIGKRYTHPTESGYDFEWRTNLDNFARPQTNLSTWNGVQTQTGQYYYDVLGNLLAKGLGATGNTTDPHLDYHFYRFDIRDQLTHNTSKHFRFGLKHDPQGNITDQYWSNESFDPTTGANVDINQYHYYYDDMNRLIGADYLSGTMTENPFADFDQLFGNIPNDFLCGVNSIAVDEYLNPVFDELKKDIEDGINVDRNLDALNGLNMLRAEYAEMDIAYSQMTSTECDKLFTNYIEAMERGRIDTKAYEMYRADKEKDDKHQDALNDGPMTIAKLKYTQILMSGVPYNPSVQCDPNESATVYGFLPTFPFPTTVTNLPKYDAAYWYTENGNITDLNRNDEGGLKTEQDYSYNASNNQLSTVDWNQQGVPSETHAMSYDANGNILNESFVGTPPPNPISAGSPNGSFVYDEYDELPTSITIDGQTRNYRYDSNGQRIVKEVDANDKNYYLDGVVIDQNNEVISYQTPEGYVTVSSDVGTGLLISDYFYNVTDWLGTNRAIMDANGNILNAHDHYPFGKRMPGRHMVTDAEGNRYQYTGHEFDEETGYGYHGARYYNRELGRYMNVDPLAEQFHNWSTYNYTMGNPINLIDPTGEGPQDIIILGASSGASGLGHGAVLIGDDKSGWTYYSKDGTTSSSGSSGDPDKNKSTQTFNTLDDFLASDFNKVDGKKYYDEAFLIKSNDSPLHKDNGGSLTSDQIDNKMKKAALEQKEKSYNVMTASCIDVCSDALDSGGFDPGIMSTWAKVGWTLLGMPFGADDRWYSGKNSSGYVEMDPNDRIEQIKKNNPHKELKVN